MKFFTSDLVAVSAVLVLLLLTLPTASARETKREPPSDDSPLYAKFDTSEGAFVIEINPSWSPLGAEHFLHLLRDQYFDGQKVRTLGGRVLRMHACTPHAVVGRWWSTVHREELSPWSVLLRAASRLTLFVCCLPAYC